VKVRTLLVVGAAFATSVFAADRFALSLAQFTQTSTVSNNTLTTTTLGTPTGLNGTVVCTALLLRSNELTWNAVPNAGGYRIERAVGSGSFSTLADSATPTYSDTAVSSGTYHYRVATTRNQWSSPVSGSITLVQPGFCL